MRATPDDLCEAPELAVLAVLDTTLDQAVLAVIAQNREITDGEDLVGLPPTAWIADVLASAAQHLQHLIEPYRRAVLDDSRYRARNPCLTPPPPRNFAE
jgi:hypothetical protein